LRDTPSVQPRKDVSPAYQCDVCYEYEKTREAFKAESGVKDSDQFSRLYDRLGELRETIDGFLKDARVESDKKAGPRMRNETWAGSSEG